MLIEINQSQKKTKIVLLYIRHLKAVKFIKTGSGYQGLEGRGNGVLLFNRHECQICKMKEF